MKFKHLIIVGIVAMITVGCATEVTSNEADTPTSTATTVASSVAKSGNFQAAEHPTQGKVSVITEAGKRYLEFDQSFKTDHGPDLFVILHRSSVPPVSGIQEKDYVSIAALQKINGTQRYALPDNVNLADFKSVAIWCRQFNATFGYAVL
ncbi:MULTISPECIES: DM13 domain-containing protein [unclassified Nodularia (in: cyanobacteria)]|uniref:DM13 domain-containing protein n=1 Tax=unclassified Nodularia (in: cyanobacteria) TaxID=2656917 RepID=UPI001880EBC1|nr:MULTISPECIES: DM13 domain-containing protein [unclassified Nodularia (in: cyanobacteria)]MBE9198461.1 DM13 domain-containing protein [Nodularia sp. LEGE 06071]MCC2691074.1 DM13 domain-containing protein [Nodularia sp. LEGE 04288]